MSEEFKWDEKYSVKVEEIDNQHKRLVELISKLYESINNQSTKEELGGILDELIDYAELHFSTEEKYFKKFDYENTEEHIQEHAKFAKKMTELKEQHSNNEIEISFELIDFLEDWLLDHVVESDQKYVDCFTTNGLK